MLRHVAPLSALASLFLALTASAAPPQISGITPFGATKGSEVPITIAGANLAGHVELIAPFAFTATLPTPLNKEAGKWTFTINVARETSLGAYAVRVRTDDGLSNPMLFVVGQLPQVAEVEDNSTFEVAQSIPPLVVVEGQTAGNDVDFFRFAGKKGQKIVVDAQCARIGSGVDPTLRLTTAARRFIGSADDSPGLLTDARLIAVLPEDTDYVIELSDTRYQGGGRPIYRLLVGAVPVAEEMYPIGARAGETVGVELRGGTLAGLQVAAATVTPPPGTELFHLRTSNQAESAAGVPAPALEVESLAPLIAGVVPEIRESADPTAAPTRGVAPVVFNGRIDPPGDEDRFTLAVTPGQALYIEVEAAESGSALDGVLQVLGANQKVLATADDTTLPTQGPKKPKAGLVSPDPTLSFTVPAGVTEITLALKDLEGRGGVGYPYRITITPTSPTFELSLVDPQVTVPKGGTAVVGVTVVRRGYTGPITLDAAHLPAGLTVRPGTIADGQLMGAFSLSASTDADIKPTYLEVVGKGTGTPEPLVVRGQKDIVFAQQGTLPTNTLTQTGIAAVSSLPTLLTLDAAAAPVEVAHGYGATVPIKVVRDKGAEGALNLTTLPLPPGLTVAAFKIDDKATSGELPVTTAVEAPLGLTTIALVAKGKIANTEQTFAVPAVTLNVVRPADVSLASPAIDVKAGATVEVKGKLARKGAFKEPVTLKLVGLPAGLKSDPLTLAPDKSDFAIPVIAEPKAAAATASAKVQMSFQVNKKDYSTPPAPLTIKVLPAN